MKNKFNKENLKLIDYKIDKSNSQIRQKVLKKKNMRNSSFELLRIILMIFIVLSHIIYYTKALPKLDLNNFKKIINNRYIFLRIISNNGKIGDILFIMISGYFSIKRINFHYIKFILIASEAYTYHYLFLFISFKLKNIYKDVEPLKQQKGSIYFPLITSLGHWFAQNYLLLLIFMPFINKGLLSLSHKQYKILVILIISFYCTIKGIINIYEISSYLFNVNLFLKLLMPYIIGSYLKIVDLKYKLFWKIAGIIFFLLTFILEFIFDKLAIHLNNFIWIRWQTQLSLNIYSILPMLSSIGIICFFKDIEIYSKIINFFSASVLGIYLIHANKNIAPFVYEGWYKTNDYNENYFFIHYFLKAFLIFIFSLIIDIIRRYTIGLLIEYILKFIINGIKKAKKV